LNIQKPYVWSSGWNSPIYCDNRSTLSFPLIRTYIKNALSRRITEQFPNAGALCGVATAGIAIGALAADELNLPYAYCRPKPKEHGMKNQLEGYLDKNTPIVVIEDLISTGGSSLKVVEYLRDEGYDVLGMAAIFSYGFEIADTNFRKAGCPYFTLSSYEELLPIALASGLIKESDLDSLKEWRLSPETWG
jgi:orotate phosphoribosyltransferase